MISVGRHEMWAAAVNCFCCMCLFKVIMVVPTGFAQRMDDDREAPHLGA